MSEADCQAAVEKWLEKQGYPLEMRTSRTFQRRGWFLHQSRIYKDPTLGKDREIDVLSFNDDPNKKLHGHFVIECKWSPDKPWVLFVTANQTLTSLGHFRSTPMTSRACEVTAPILEADIPWFPLFSGIEEGYSVVQAFGRETPADAAYSAVQSAVGAANFFAVDMDKDSSDHSIVYVPTIVLAGPLFRCSLSDKGDVSVLPINIGCVLHRTIDFNACVHIVRESALDEFIDRAEATFKSLRTILSARSDRAQNQPKIP